MFPGLTELLLIGCLIGLILDPKIQIKNDTKNQLADILTKGNFTRDEWIHLLCFFKKQMTNFVSRCREGDPTVLASTASENPGNTKSESQNVPLNSLNVQQTGTRKPGTLASSSNFQVAFSCAEIW